MARPKGTIKTLNNTEVVSLLSPLRSLAYDVSSFKENVPAWLDDCLRGATGQLQSTNRPSNYRVFCFLATLREINSNTVGSRLNKKRRAVEGKEYSYSYINQWVVCLRCAAQAVLHHAPEEGLSHLADVEAEVIPELIYTSEQKEHIRDLALAGKLDVLSEYVRGIHDENL